MSARSASASSSAAVGARSCAPIRAADGLARPHWRGRRRPSAGALASSGRSKARCATWRCRSRSMRPDRSATTDLAARWRALEDCRDNLDDGDARIALRQALIDVRSDLRAGRVWLPESDRSGPPRPVHEGPGDAASPTRRSDGLPGQVENVNLGQVPVRDERVTQALRGSPISRSCTRRSGRLSVFRISRGSPAGYPLAVPAADSPTTVHRVIYEQLDDEDRDVLLLLGYAVAARSCWSTRC